MAYLYYYLYSFLPFLIFSSILSLKNLLMLSILYNNSFKIKLSGIYSIIYSYKTMLLTHLPFILIIASLGLFIKKRQALFYIAADVCVTILFLLDIYFMRLTGKFFSFKLLFKELPYMDISFHINRFFSLKDILFVLDLIILLLLWKKISSWNISFKEYKKNIISAVIIIILSTLSIYLNYNIFSSPNSKANFKPFATYWEPYSTMFEASPIGYRVYKSVLSPSLKYSITEKDQEEISKWLKANKEDIKTNSLKGLFKGKNLVILQIEAFESFMIKEKVMGEEITPNINKLLKNSFYFPNVYSQINGGVSSDADFMINTSLLPVRGGATFLNYPYNSYNSLPKLLKKYGYTSMMFHGERGGNWNFKVADKNLGFDKVLDINFINFPSKYKKAYSSTNDYLIIDSFIQNIIKLKTPFFGQVVTLDSHAHFDYINEEDTCINLPADIEASVFGKYLRSIHYEDKIVSYLIEKLKETSLLENTVLVITGDHSGYKLYYKDEIKETNLKFPWVGNSPHGKVPFIIFNPSLKGEKFDINAGQIDIMPTLAYLMGVDSENYIESCIGKNLLNTNKNYTILNDGTLIGLTPSKEEGEHFLKALDISDMIIKYNYFKNK